MESKRMLVTMMIVMVMGNLLIQTEAQGSAAFATCFPNCLQKCAMEKQFPFAFTCPLTCIMQCFSSPPSFPSPPSQMIATTESDHFCKLGCAVQHCVPLSTLKNPNVDAVVGCVDSCSGKCSNNN